MVNNLIATEHLKYNLAERLDKIGNRRRLYIRQTIIDQHKIGTSTYDRWLKIKDTDQADIPGKALIHFAKLIGVSVPELLNDNN